MIEFFALGIEFWIMTFPLGLVFAIPCLTVPYWWAGSEALKKSRSEVDWFENHRFTPAYWPLVVGFLLFVTPFGFVLAIVSWIWGILVHQNHPWRWADRLPGNVSESDKAVIRRQLQKQGTLPNLRCPVCHSHDVSVEDAAAYGFEPWKQYRCNRCDYTEMETIGSRWPIQRG